MARVSGAFEKAIAAINEITSRENEDKEVERVRVSKLVPPGVIVSLPNKEGDLELHVSYTDWYVLTKDAKEPSNTVLLFYGIPVTYE